MSLLPIMGALFEGIASILVKKIITKRKVNRHNFVIYVFSSALLVLLPLIYFFWDVKPGATNPVNILLLLAVVITSIFAIFSVLYSLKREDLSEIEPVRLLMPLITILLTFVFSFFFQTYADERNYSILGLSIIASIVLVSSHIKKHHFVFDRYLVAALISSFLFAFEMVLSKPLLDYYNPITFYFVRSLLIFSIVWIFVHPKLTGLEKSTKLMIGGLAAIGVLTRIIIYYGYQTLGIVFTTTLFILAPVFVYIFAAIFLKEKITKRQIISSIVIVACVVAAIWVGSYCRP